MHTFEKRARNDVALLIAAVALSLSAFVVGPIAFAFSVPMALYGFVRSAARLETMETMYSLLHERHEEGGDKT